MRFAFWAAALALSLLARPHAATAADVIQVGSGTFQVTLQWTTPGDDSTLGRATSFDLRYYVIPIDPINLSQAVSVNGLSAPGLAGSVFRVTLVGLDPSKTYWFAVRTSDERGNWSLLSNLANTALPPVDVGSGGAVAAFSLPAPNPAHGDVRFDLSLPRPGAVRVVAFDAAGRVVRRLAEGDLPAGQSKLGWDLRDDDGRALPSGLYLVRAELPDGAITRRVIVSR